MMEEGRWGGSWKLEVGEEDEQMVE